MSEGMVVGAGIVMLCLVENLTAAVYSLSIAQGLITISAWGLS